MSKEKYKKKKYFQKKKQFGAPCEATVVEKHVSSENVSSYILLVDDHDEDS